MQWESVWQFNTAQFTVDLSVTPEDTNPADQFEDESDIALAQEGGWNWFAARVQVKWRDDANLKNWAVKREDVLGEDHLGCCSYHDLQDFKRDGYFRDMVAEAIREARSHLSRLHSIKVRA